MRARKVKIIRHYEVDENATFAQKWIRDVLNDHELNYTSLARMLHVTKQTISNWLSGASPSIPFTVVATIIYLLDMDDDPEEIYSRIANNKGE